MSQTEGHNTQLVYQIKVKGVLDTSWSNWLGGLTIKPLESGNTLLVGPVRDQSALHGLLNKIRDMGVVLLSVHLKEDA